MGVVERRVHCDKRTPPEKHEWRDDGTRASGRNRLQKWCCRKCGATTTNDGRRYLT